MTSIFRNGAGHVLPLKKPGCQTYFGGPFEANVSTSQGSRWGSDEGSPGHNLVVNRKSLHSEQARQNAAKISEENLRFLSRL
jgi:hypothetical protein